MPGKKKDSSNQENRGKGTYSGNNIARNSGKAFKKKGKNGWLQGLKIIAIALAVLLILIVAGGLTIAYSYLQDTPEFNPDRLMPAVTSHIFDRHGNEITALFYDQNRIKISLDEIPLHVQNAFIAIEDARFYDHIGIDPIGFARAVLINLRQLSLTGPGGSTITQQLIKNAFLTPEKTLERKVQEAYLAIKMERRYSKAEILEFYLNQIAFGHGAHGIEVASNMYFQKNTGELTIAEAALLAAIPRAPSFYSPFINKEVALHRQGLVLQRMYDLGFISHQEWLEAAEQEIVLAESPSREYPFPYFIDYVLHHELMEILLELPMFNTREEAYEAIYNQGLRIYTTLDPRIQEITQSAISNENHYPQNFRVDMPKMKKLLSEKNYSSYPEAVLAEHGIMQPQGAAVVADPATGEVLALVGGRDYGPDNKLLRYLSPRQPGSAIKPLVAYAPAMEKNLITPGSIIDDAPFVRGDWTPENFDRDFRGLVTVRESLVRSLNIPAVRTFELLTPSVGIDYARRMGLTTIHDDDYNLATTLGGMTQGVTAFDMAQAYAVLANQGIKVDLHTIKRVEDRNGQLLFAQRSDPQTVISPQTAYLITDILKDAVHHGTASRLRIGRPVAAKTGTTDDNRDAYLVAYTPDLVVSIWLGHDIPALGRIRGGSRTTIPFMNDIMSQVLKNREPLDFTRPPGITGPIAICRKSGLRPGDYCPPDSIVNEIFPTAIVPRETCNLHVEMKICRASGLLASEYCPAHEITTGTFLLRPEFIITDKRWKGKDAIGRAPLDAALSPPTEHCDMHVKPAPPPTELNLFLMDNPLTINLWWEWQDNVHEYLIYRRVAGSDEQIFLQRIPGNTNHFADQTVEYGVTYIYRLFSVNTEGVRSLPAERTISTHSGSGVSHPPLTLPE
ncbi:MAG TPA: penicillin-binding protein [Firmicutes bacterium]|nr:penicillin-binding protein [Bacillota bacterium]